MNGAEDEEGLHEAATARAGYRDFGTDVYLDGLRIVLESLRDDANNLPLRETVMRHATDALVGRLHSEAGWKAYPDCLQLTLQPPLVVTGLPRTGTSLMHHLLANDPQFQWMPNWIAMAPRVRTPRASWQSDPTFNAAILSLESVFRDNPQMRAAHNSEAALPEECIRTMIQSFISMRFVSTLPLPRYERWFMEQDESPSYRRFADNLRLMGAGSAHKPWLLKNPSHAMGIDALLKVFPKARIVVTFRDPRDSIASGASVILRSAGSLWRTDQIGAHRLRVWSNAAKRLERAIANHPDRFIEISYDDLLANPLGAVGRIYDRFGLSLDETTTTAMRAWLADNQQGKHGDHRYSLESVGLDRDRIGQALGFYIIKYGFKP